MQLSAVADTESAVWDIAIDGRWLGEGPGDRVVVEFDTFEPANLGSARLLVVWLENGDTYTLAALRPQNAKGQDRDDIAVGLPDSKSALQVFDPRLSTEYSTSGVPQRFGLELWLGEDPDGDQHPLRIGGEAVSEDAALQAGSLSIHPMRAHSADTAGLGLYVLVR